MDMIRVIIFPNNGKLTKQLVDYMNTMDEYNSVEYGTVKPTNIIKLDGSNIEYHKITVTGKIVSAEIWRHYGCTVIFDGHVKGE